MKKKLAFGLIVIGVALFLDFKIIPITVAETDNQKTFAELNAKIAEYQEKIKTLQAESGTLSNQIAQFDAQIELTRLKIDQTREQILLLGGRIDQLEVSLDNLNSAFSMRAIETYKLSKIGTTTTLLLSPKINEAVVKFHYLQKIQEADRALLERLQTAQNTYQVQREDFVELEQVLGVQKEELDQQKSAKANLLWVTKSDEKKYQQLLASARAEYEAIQAIIAGQGDEEELGHVNAGDRIASVIQGASCNSDGSHLHFIVAENNDIKNPFNYLTSINYENCSGSGECSLGDPFNPTGGWSWPINPTVKFTQGYGYTWAVQNTWVGRIYQFHNGIDINSNDSNIKAVKSGNLFRGSYGGSGGCRLRYVRVEHDEGNFETYYLHINY